MVHLEHELCNTLCKTYVRYIKSMYFVKLRYGTCSAGTVMEEVRYILRMYYLKGEYGTCRAGTKQKRGTVHKCTVHVEHVLHVQ